MLLTINFCILSQLARTRAHPESRTHLECYYSVTFYRPQIRNHHLEARYADVRRGELRTPYIACPVRPYLMVRNNTSVGTITRFSQPEPTDTWPHHPSNIHSSNVLTDDALQIMRDLWGSAVSVLRVLATVRLFTRYVRPTSSYLSHTLLPCPWEDRARLPVCNSFFLKSTHLTKLDVNYTGRTRY